MVFKDFRTFKQTFSKLFKKYHPDNLETGDAEKFMAYKKMYDDTIKIKNTQIKVDITTTQAYFGTIINTKKFTIIISPKYYPNNKPTVIIGKDGQKYQVFVNIIAENDECIKYEGKDKELMITKIIPVNLFEILLGCKKTITVLGETLELKLTPNDVLSNHTKVLPYKGYIKRDKSGRNPLTLKFKYVNTILDDEDLTTLKEMSEKYD